MAKEVNTYTAPEIFASPPPVDTLRYLLLRAAQSNEMSIMHNDATRACFHIRDNSVGLFPEDKAEGKEQMRGKREQAMYGSSTQPPGR